MTTKVVKIKVASFGTRAQLLICCLLLLCATSCRTHKSTNKTQHETPEHVVIPSDTPKLNQRIVEEACTWIGTPYCYAGSTKGEGTDCSGMVMVVYEQVTGIKLPRNSAKQAEFCDKIAQDELEPGDLAFFATGKDPSVVSHVGIMLNSKSFVHASSSKGVVVSDITTPYYSQRLIMLGRVPGMATDKHKK